MNWQFRLRNLPKPIKGMLTTFILVMLFGYSTSFVLLADTTQLKAQGIEENYLGNEDLPETDGPLKFRKSKHEMMNIVHTHAFVLGILFLITGLMIYFCGIPVWLKKFLMIEPLLSIIFTFGFILIVWKGYSSFKYLAMISGIIMHFSFLSMLFLIFRELYFSKIQPSLKR